MTRYAPTGGIVPWSAGLVGRFHMEREHLVRLDPGEQRAGVEEALPFRAVARNIDVEERLPELGVLLAAHVDGNGASVDGHGELLAREMRGADVRPSLDVAEPDRIGRGAEVERAAEEDPVHGPDDRAAVGGGGGE